MKNFKAKDLLIPGLVLFVISLVTTLLLALTNQVTAPIIEDMAVQTAVEAQKKVLQEAESFSDQALLAKLDGKEYEYYEGFDSDGKLVGYVFTTVSKGYGGEIKLMSGIDKDGAIAGLEVLHMSETPGLGMNAAEDSFLNLFKGKAKSVKITTSKASGDEIAALTGATVTSDALGRAVNQALDLFQYIAGGSPNG
ncbi:MAG: RnfABCDGE type electron transport complex subunit G [Clostridiales bacterium]|nr:RnfABCDGE type electron transport complex subunit G [Clostridiales bacterium]